MKKSDLQRIGEIIKSHRLKNKLTQEELADKAELHRTYIGMIERGEKNITILNLLKLSKALKLHVSKLLIDY